MEQPAGERGGAIPRAASQSSLDESSQRAGGGAAAGGGGEGSVGGGGGPGAAGDGLDCEESPPYLLDGDEDGAGEGEGEGEAGAAGEGAAHATRLLGALAALRRERALCDVILHARAPANDHLPEDDKGGDAAEAEAEEESEGGVAAHRAVLAACSPYFRAMFSQWAERARTHITLREVEPAALDSIVQWMYCPRALRVQPDTVQALLAAASLLQCAGVIQRCAAFLQAALAPDNALGILSFAELHSCGALAGAARRHVTRHFGAVAAHDEFLALSARQLCALLADDALCCEGGEGAVLDAALRWLQHEPARERHCLEVVSCVRLALLPREALVARARAPPLRAAPAAVKDLLIDALSHQLLPAAATAPPRRRAPRAPRLILVVGGQAPKAIREVEAYDPERERWAPRRELLTRRCRAGVCALEGRVYAVGGFNGTLRVRGVDVYEPLEDRWSAGPPLCARRSTLGVCALGGRLYAVGGFDGAAGLSSAEVLEPAAGAWRPIADMATRRSSVGVCALDGFVYAVGGYDGATRQCLASVERYDPAADRWEAVASMAARRSGAGVAALGGQVYAAGGHDGPAVRRSVERLRPRAGPWRPAPAMRVARRNAAVLAHDNRLYVLGGDDGATNLDSVEVFDPATDCWTELDARMSIGRSYAGVAVVERA